METLAQQILDTINDMVTFTTTNAIGITRGGMNIYMPYLAQQWDPAYGQTDFAANNWGTFVQSFIGGIETLLAGSLTVHSAPAGAAVTLDGADTGETTPVTFELSEGSFELGLTLTGFMPWSRTVQVEQGETTTVTANLVPEGGNDDLIIQGRIAWNDGRALTDCYVLLFEEAGGQLALFAAVDVDEATGDYQVSFPGDHTFWMEALDDVDGSQSLTAGDGWNAIDYDQDGQYPTYGDGVPMVEGHTYPVDFTVYEFGGMKSAAHRLFRPVNGGVSAEELNAALRNSN